jgi:hypothetical protein
MEKKPKVCGAQLRKKPGQFCNKAPIKGKRRCRLHGGKSLAGVASGSFKHGRYSRYLPKDLRKQYEQTKYDPQLLSHEPDLRLMDVRLQGLIANLANTSSLEAFSRAQEEWEKLEQAQDQGDLIEVGRIMLRLRDLMRATVPAGQTWEVIERVTEQRRKLLESESRRIQQNSNSMSGEQILALIEYIVDVLRSSVIKYADRLIASKILNQVTTDIGVVVSRPDKAPPGTARLLT